MKEYLLIILAGTLTGVVDQPPREKKKPAGLHQLQGDWILIAMERRGQAMTPEYIQRFAYQLHIEGNNYTMNMRGRRGLVYQIQVSPKGDKGLLYLQLHRLKRTYKGICQVEGDTLKVCYETGRGEPPTSFATQNARFTLYVFQRAKH